MKYLDRVKLISDEYEKDGVKKGQIGTIINAEIRSNEFYISFEPERYDCNEEDRFCGIKIKDLKLVWCANASDEAILEDLPLHDPNWWCKVENGFILNLKGEKKNKIPYDYDS